MSLNVVFGAERLETSESSKPLLDIVVISSIYQASRSYDHLLRNFKDTISREEQYDIRISGFDVVIDTNSASEIFNYLNSKSYVLLTEILTKLLQPAAKTCNLVFVCYSLGSFVVKQALLQAESSPNFQAIHSSTRGIAFVSAIHNDASTDFRDCMKKCLAIELGTSEDDRRITEILNHRNIANLEDTCKRFRELDLQCVLNSSFEKNKSRVRKTTLLGCCRYSTTSNVVSREIAKLGFSQVQYTGLKISHHEAMTMYGANPETASFYAQSIESIAQIVQAAERAARPAPAIQNENPFKEKLEAERFEISEHVVPRGVNFAHWDGLVSDHDVRCKLPCYLTHPHESNPDMMERRNLLPTIAEVLDPQAKTAESVKAFVLFGVGGMGKTQTSLKYVFNRLKVFGAVLWTRADTTAKLAQGFADFAYELGLVESPTADQGYCKTVVLNWFKKTRVPWLVVFDNLDGDGNHARARDYWPRGPSGSLLITTRDPSVQGGLAEKGMRLGPMESDEAITLLLRVSQQTDTPENHESALKISKQVDQIPLALTQAATLIRREQMTLEDFLIAYSNEDLLRRSTVGAGGREVYEHSLSTALSKYFHHLDDDARELVNIMAFLDPDKIPEHIFADGAEESPRKKYIKSRGELIARDIIQRNVTSKEVWIHRLMQESCRLQMSTEAWEKAFCSAVDLLHRIWPVPERHNRHRPELWKVQQDWIAHVVSLAQQYEHDRTAAIGDRRQTSEFKPPEQFAELLYNAAWYFYERGQLMSADPLLQIAEFQCKRYLENPELIMADISGCYASILSERNEREASLRSFQKQHEYLYAALEKNLWQRPNVREALTLGGLGNGLCCCDRLAEAEKYYRDCLVVWEKCPGAPTIYALHLGTCLAFQGKTQEAEEIVRQIIVEREKEFGPQDTQSYRTGIAYFALGVVLDEEGRFEEGFEMHQIALHLIKKVEGDDHHLTADSYYKIGWHFNRINNHKEARENLLAANKIFEADDSYKHEAARTSFLLGNVLVQAGDTEEGQRLLNKAEERRKEILGPKWKPAQGEKDYDRLIMFWSR